MTDMIIETKIEDMMVYGYTALRQFPKSEKYGMAADIKAQMDLILERTIEAKKHYYKKTTLRDLDVSLEKLRKYLRLAMKMKCLPMKQYEIWTGQIAEIGKMVGGWINSVQK